MKIRSVSTRMVNVPLAQPIGTAIHAINSVGCVLVEARSDDGVVGQSYVFTINANRLRAFDEMITGLAELALIGADPHDTEGIWHRLWGEVNPTGHKGVTISAMSALDVACWDLVGRAHGLALHKMWGACRSRISTYASSGLWLSQSLDELVAEAGSRVSQGFTAMKVRIGNDRSADDVERVRAVRDAVGEDVDLLVDANQKFTPKEAIRLGRALAEFNLVWFEEPVAAYDLAGHARVRDALDLPVASGETEYTRFGMQSMLDAGAADILMPDLQRIGGYNEFHKASATASAQNTPVSSHFFTEYSLCLAGSAQNCISAEHIDWFAPLFNESMDLVDGSDHPGSTGTRLYIQRGFHRTLRDLGQYPPAQARDSPRRSEPTPFPRATSTWLHSRWTEHAATKALERPCSSTHSNAHDPPGRNGSPSTWTLTTKAVDASTNAGA